MSSSLNERPSPRAKLCAKCLQHVLWIVGGVVIGSILVGHPAHTDVQLQDRALQPQATVHIATPLRRDEPTRR